MALPVRGATAPWQGCRIMNFGQAKTGTAIDNLTAFTVSIVDYGFLCQIGIICLNHWLRPSFKKSLKS